jgi:hypothetical protein
VAGPTAGAITSHYTSNNTLTKLWVYDARDARAI